MRRSGRILITGANRGIGLALAGHFLARGWRVAAACRDPAGARALAALAARHPGRCDVLALEVRDAASVAALAAALGAGGDTLDVLVNNAGINPAPREHTVADVAVAAVAEALDVNLLGALRVLQAVVPLLRRSGRPRVVNISSGGGSMTRNSAPAGRPQTAYCLSKAGLNMLTVRAARDLPEFTVVSVSPGWIRTDMGGPAAELDPVAATADLATTIEQLQPHHSGQWLNRFGQPSEYAW
ncbi:MAG: SDR family NAD(P)-dependent oxidoreductase [Opitutaceae bacterium]|nr:SDR family NAD(P)-dependent oxidoreductase [Opitutaceae bacterium]